MRFIYADDCCPGSRQTVAPMSPGREPPAGPVRLPMLSRTIVMCVSRMQIAALTSFCHKPTRVRADCEGMGTGGATGDSRVRADYEGEGIWEAAGDSPTITAAFCGVGPGHWAVLECERVSQWTFTGVAVAPARYCDIQAACNRSLVSH